MPDSAFEDTHRQFNRLVRAAGQPAVELTCYEIPDVPRSRAARRAVGVRQQPADRLYDDPPDALIITGTEPARDDLASEPYWPSLEHLLRWAEATVPSTMLSCLASHAAVLALDGVTRRPLPAKQSGVFTQQVNRSHPLAQGLGTQVAFPHSRLNDVPSRALRGRGYQLVVASDDSGWTVASRERQGRILVLLQGHPEYDSTTLLREYRRDVRRHLQGTRPTYPDIPSHYLDEAGERLLATLRARHLDKVSAGCGEPFPFEEAARHVVARWDDASDTLFANWVSDAHGRACRAAA
jgi:homoserine O-succinyltransferase/O-acetyltransferase